MRRALIVLALAQLADVLTTAYDMAHGGVEANPIIRTAIAVGGVPAMFTLKAATFAVIAWLAMNYSERASVRRVVIVGATLTAFVAANNLIIGGS
jgi:hypothetical protein